MARVQTHSTAAGAGGGAELGAVRGVLALLRRVPAATVLRVLPHQIQARGRVVRAGHVVGGALLLTALPCGMPRVVGALRGAPGLIRQGADAAPFVHRSAHQTLLVLAGVLGDARAIRVPRVRVCGADLQQFLEPVPLLGEFVLNGEGGTARRLLYDRAPSSESRFSSCWRGEQDVAGSWKTVLEEDRYGLFFGDSFGTKMLSSRPGMLMQCKTV